MRGDILMTPCMCAALGRVEPELVGLPWKALSRDATRRLQFVVHATDWQHSMALHGHSCCDSVGWAYVTPIQRSLATFMGSHLLMQRNLIIGILKSYLKF